VLPPRELKINIKTQTKSVKQDQPRVHTLKLN